MVKKNIFHVIIILLIVVHSAVSQAKIDACFEYFVDGHFAQFSSSPNTFQDIQALRDWYNPTESHPNVLISPTLVGGPQTGVNGLGITPNPPNNSNSFIGLGISSPNGLYTPKVSYIATNLLVPLEAGVSYDFEFYVGSAGVGFEGGDFLGNIVLLGCDNCSLPLQGTDCKEDELIILGEKQINIVGGTWFPNKLVFSFTPSIAINKIIIGPGCNPWPTGDSDGVYYLLLDDLCIKKSIIKPQPNSEIIHSKIKFKKQKSKGKGKY